MFKAACVQLCATRDVEENIETSARLIRQAAADGATYIQTPEMTHLVETDRTSLMKKISYEEEDKGVAAYQKLAKELSITLHIGSLAILRRDGKIANRGFIFGAQGEKIASYDKIHMFDVDLDNGETWRESNSYEAGSEAPVVSIGGELLGMAICYDLRFAHLFRRQAQAGARILTVPACFTRHTGKAHWHVLLRARAIETGCFVIAAAQGGYHVDGRVTFGHSMIVNPWGRVLEEADNDKQDIISATFDAKESDHVRKSIPSLFLEANFKIRKAYR